MKLNNKGFAITGILYGLLILFALLVGTYLTILTAKKNRLDGIISDIEKEYNTTYTVTLYVDSKFNSDTVVHSGRKYEKKFNTMTGNASVSCTNSQTASVLVDDSYNVTITIDKVTEDITCYVEI